MGNMRKVRGMSRAEATLDFREALGRALRRRVGTGRPLSAAELADRIGAGRRTVESWLYGETAPRGSELRALIAFFDGDFATEVLAGTGKIVLDRAVLDRLPELADAVRSLSALSTLLREMEP